VAERVRDFLRKTRFVGDFEIQKRQADPNFHPQIFLPQMNADDADQKSAWQKNLPINQKLPEHVVHGIERLRTKQHRLVVSWIVDVVCRSFEMQRS
jgi:hypothetical protein